MNDLQAIDTSRATLPSTYHAAKRAISQCASIDECKEWSDKAAALASYAKQAGDDQLEKMARRIRARATRRAGEILKQIEPAQGGDRGNQHRQRDGSVPLPSRRQAAADAGLSERQQKTAQRLANIPEDDFEGMVEADATITQLADAGTVKGAATNDKAAAGALVGAMRAYSERLSGICIDAAIASLSASQRAEIRMLVARLDAEHDRIATRA